MSCFFGVGGFLPGTWSEQYPREVTVEQSSVIVRLFPRYACKIFLQCQLFVQRIETLQGGTARDAIHPQRKSAISALPQCSVLGSTVARATANLPGRGGLSQPFNMGKRKRSPDMARLKTWRATSKPSIGSKLPPELILKMCRHPSKARGYIHRRPPFPPESVHGCFPLPQEGSIRFPSIPRQRKAISALRKYSVLGSNMTMATNPQGEERCPSHKEEEANGLPI